MDLTASVYIQVKGDHTRSGTFPEASLRCCDGKGRAKARNKIRKTNSKTFGGPDLMIIRMAHVRRNKQYG